MKLRSKRQTVAEWADEHEGANLVGLVVRVPERHRKHLPATGTDFALRSVWSMGERRRGLWVGTPGQRTGQVWPIFDVPAEEFFEWEVVTT